MSRRIATGIDPTKGPVSFGPGPITASAAQAASVDDFLARMVKYIPSEIIALYVAAKGVLGAAPTTESLWAIFAACTVFTPFYMFFTTRDPDKGPLWLQIALATLAFAIWVFALGGPFATWNFYIEHPKLGPLVLIFATAGFGLIKPKQGT